MKPYTTTIDYGSPEYDLNIRLRTDVLRKPLGLEFSIEQIEAEATEVHFACYDSTSGTLLGCATMAPYNETTWKMRQVAVDTHFQHRGIGRMLVQACERYTTQQGINHIILHARDTAVPFYLHNGYTQTGAPFQEVGIQHYLMEKKW
jgi:predicted GNAT family N-acyltransferase